MLSQQSTRAGASRQYALPSAFAPPEKPLKVQQPRLTMKRRVADNDSQKVVMLPSIAQKQSSNDIVHEIHIDEIEGHANEQTRDDISSTPYDPIVEFYNPADCATNFNEFSHLAIDPQNVAINILPINTMSLHLTTQTSQTHADEAEAPITSTSGLQSIVSKLRSHMLSAQKSNNHQITSSLDHLSRISSIYPKRSPNYSLLSMQKHITSSHRAVAFSYMFQTYHDFQMQHGTLHLAISMLDRYMSSPFVKLVPDNLLLTSITALFLAYKLEDNRSVHAPNFEKLTANRFTRADGQRTESMLLSSLSFEVAVPTIADFATQFLYLFVSTQQCDIPELIKSPIQNINPKSGRFFRLLHCVEFLTDIAVSDWSYSNMSPIALGAAILYVALIILSIDFPQSWNISLQLLTGLTAEDILPVAKHLCQVARRVKKEKRIYEPLLRRYSSEYYYRIATAHDIPSDAQLEHSVMLNNTAIVEFLNILHVTPDALTFVAGLHVGGFRVLQITQDRRPTYDDDEVQLVTDSAFPSSLSMLNTSMHGDTPLELDAEDDSDDIRNDDGSIDPIKVREAHKQRQLKHAAQLLSPKLKCDGQSGSGSPSKSISVYHYQKEYLVTLIRDSSENNFFIQNVHNRQGDMQASSDSKTLRQVANENEPAQVVVKVWMKMDAIYEFADGDIALTEYKSAKKLAKQAKRIQVDNSSQSQTHPASGRSAIAELPPLPSPLFTTNSYLSTFSASTSSSSVLSGNGGSETLDILQLGSPKPKLHSAANDDLACLFGSPKYHGVHSQSAGQKRHARPQPHATGADGEKSGDAVKRKRPGACNIM